jgi:PAS domain S-box-containing protein
MSDSQESPAGTVSKLKKAEAQLRLMTKVFMDSADPIVIRDLEGRVLDVNHETERVFGWSRDELIGKRTDHLHSAELRELLQEAHDRRVQGEILRNYEVNVRAKSGRWVPVLGTAFLLTDANDVPVGMADILKDFTLIKQAREKVEQRNRDLKLFSRALSHDLATPLGAIRGFAELLLMHKSDQLDEEGRKFCRSIVDGADGMSAMIHDLLELAALESDRERFAPVDTSTALERALDNLRALIQENDARVTSDPLPTVHGSDSLLCRLFQNLVGNAIKFRRDEPPRVRVSAERFDDAWRFSVRDNGIGIDSEYHEKIFNPLQRLHAEGIFPGTGIGLAACRAIVERHGGRIWVESQRGSGSTFRFTITQQLTEEG